MKKIITTLSTLGMIVALHFAANPTILAQEIAHESSSSSAKRPNILLIISDDIGVDVTSDMYPGLIDNLLKQYGPDGLNHPNYKSIAGKQASTPSLNKLAQQGMAFSNVWAHPFCSPTRAAILTGLYGKDTKVLSYADPLSEHHTSFVKILKDQGGYSTGLFGKWHLAGLPGRGDAPDYPGMKPKQAGFDFFQGNLHAAIATYWRYDYQSQNADTPAEQWLTNEAPARSLPGIAATTYAPVVKIADAITWIAQQEKQDPNKPWFAWVAFNLSHATAIQQPSAMAVPNIDTMDAQSIAEMKACGGEFGSNNTGTCSGEALMRAMTNSLDTVTGKLLDAVEQLDPNTYIIFIGDNGTPMYARPNLDFIDNMYITRDGRGKGTAYESGARVPMVIKGPDIKANTTSHEFAHSADVFSTALSLAGINLPAKVSNSEGQSQLSLDAKSLTPILFDRKKSIRDPNQDYTLTESLNLLKLDEQQKPMQQVGVRNGTHKVICTSDTSINNCEFYNLEKDPLEEFPLAKPDSCDAYNKLTAADESWHFCRLSTVIREKSFLQ